MLDTQNVTERIEGDAALGPYPRFSPAAIERAKALLGISDIDKLGIALGYSRAGFYRARNGRHDPRLSTARRIARRLGMRLDEAFEDGCDG